MEHGLVTDIAICIIAAWVVAVISQVARQPLLLAYLIAGFLVGPHGFQWITDAESVKTISTIGLSLLLFMIGLEMDLKTMLGAGRVITVTAAAQILGCVTLGWLVFEFIGPARGHLEALYLAMAAGMSSTVIIVKILYDKREIETLPGRVTLGVLVLQDVAIILFLALQPNLKNPALNAILIALGHVILLASLAFLASRFVLPPVFKFIAKLPELILVGALAWCFALAGLADYLKLSPAMGALIAGIMISTFPYTLDVMARVTSLRDFFVTLFFVGLGIEIPVPTWHYVLWTLFLCVVILVTRVATVFPPLYLMRRGFRVSFLTTLYLCQMSELSLILLSLGNQAGDVSDDTVGICAFAFAILAVGSTYSILKSDRILRRTIPWLYRLGLWDIDRNTLETSGDTGARRICLLGFSGTASSLIEEMARHRPALLSEVFVVDFNPQVIERLRARQIRVVYGDIAERDVLMHAGVGQAGIIICSLPNMVLKGANNLKMLRQVRELNPTANIVVHAELLSEIPSLYAAGASYVTAPRLLESADLLQFIEAADKNRLEHKRGEQSQKLDHRNEVIP